MFLGHSSAAKPRAQQAPRRETLARWCAALIALVPVYPLAAQSTNPTARDSDAVTETSRRAVREFTFEESANPDEVPAGWVRAQSAPPRQSDHDGLLSRPGFPEFNRAAFDFTRARSGLASVRLPTQGGSTSLRLMPGQLPIFPDADYLITAHIQTDALRAARAFLVARLLDQRSVPIPGAESRSIPVLSPGGWTPVSVTVPGQFPRAAWLQIDLELLQPAQFEPAPVGPLAQHAIVREDVRGAAWFDDVAVLQIPRARLWSSQPDNVFLPGSRADQPPTVFFSARDLASLPLTAEVAVFDTADRRVDQLVTPITPDARPISWSPRLRAFGWYTVRLTVRAGDQAVSSARIDLAYLSPPRDEPLDSLALAADRARFGIIAEDLPEPLLIRLPTLIDAIGTGFVVLPLFDAAAPADQQPALAAARTPLYANLLERGQVITLSLPRVPEALARSLALDATDTVGLVARSQSAWAPFLQPTIDTFGQRLTRYQLGPVGDPHVLRRDPAPPLSALEAVLARLVPDPHLSLNWWADHDPPTLSRTDPSSRAGHPLVDGVTLAVPAAFPPGAIGNLVSNWAQTSIEPGMPPPQLTIVPELLNADRFGPDARVAEMARRAVEFWAAPSSSSAPAAAQPTRFALVSPWRITTDKHALDDSARRMQPGPALVALHTLIQRLAGRRVVGTLAAPDGVRALILAARATGEGSLERGAIIAWNISAPADRARVEFAPAASSATLIDIFGNAQPISPASNPSANPELAALVPILSAPVSQTPVFIEGIDPYLALFVSSFRIEPAFLRAVASEHDQRLILSNPWPVRITGKIQIRREREDPATADLTQPRSAFDESTVSPQGAIDFTIDPAQTLEIPFTVTLSTRQLAGKRDVSVVARVQADRAYPPIRLTAPVEIGLPELEVTPELVMSPGPDGPDALINVTITNRDTRARALFLEAAVPGRPTQQIQISELAPGAATQRRFAFQDAAADLAGRRILISLSDPESAARLNKAVQVP